MLNMAFTHGFENESDSFSAFVGKNVDIFWFLSNRNRPNGLPTAKNKSTSTKIILKRYSLINQHQVAIFLLLLPLLLHSTYLKDRLHENWQFGFE